MESQKWKLTISAGNGIPFGSSIGLVPPHSAVDL
jgi:hypothetical protein